VVLTPNMDKSTSKRQFDLIAALTGADDEDQWKRRRQEYYGTQGYGLSQFPTTEDDDQLPDLLLSAASGKSIIIFYL